MEAAHMNVVRVGEFAWSALERSKVTMTSTGSPAPCDSQRKHHIAVVMRNPHRYPTAMAHQQVPRKCFV